tara:strand:- start:1472 stop:1660 length:189 start_codon:yes stop_codon:yes gene_type:complete
MWLEGWVRPPPWSSHRPIHLLLAFSDFVEAFFSGCAGLTLLLCGEATKDQAGACQSFEAAFN